MPLFQSQAPSTTTKYLTVLKLLLDETKMHLAVTWARFYPERCSSLFLSVKAPEENDGNSSSPPNPSTSELRYFLSHSVTWSLPRTMRIRKARKWKGLNYIKDPLLPWIHPVSHAVSCLLHSILRLSEVRLEQNVNKFWDHNYIKLKYVFVRVM